MLALRSGTVRGSCRTLCASHLERTQTPLPLLAVRTPDMNQESAVVFAVSTTVMHSHTLTRERAGDRVEQLKLEYQRFQRTMHFRGRTVGVHFVHFRQSQTMFRQDPDRQGPDCFLVDTEKAEAKQKQPRGDTWKAQGEDWGIKAPPGQKRMMRKFHKWQKKLHQEQDRREESRRERERERDRAREREREIKIDSYRSRCILYFLYVI